MKLKQNDDWQKLVGQRLEQARIVLGKKHVEMARVADASPQAWNNYTKGARPLALEGAILLCNRYGLTLDWIYRGRTEGLPHSLADKLMQETSTVVPIKRR